MELKEALSIVKPFLPLFKEAPIMEAWQTLEDYCTRSTPDNSDYAVALKVVGEFCIKHSSAEQCIDFRGWLLQRLNETRSHSA
jgi:hypothetical protein